MIKDQILSVNSDLVQVLCVRTAVLPEAAVQYPVISWRLSYTISVLFVIPFSLHPYLLFLSNKYVTDVFVPLFGDPTVGCLHDCRNLAVL